MPGRRELPFEARWVTALHGLDPDARRREIGEVRKRWAARQRGLGAILTEIVRLRATRRSAPAGDAR